MTGRRSHDAAGMTLLEVVFAATILISALLVVAQVLFGASRASRDATERTHARAAAEARLSELRTLLHLQAWTTQQFHDDSFNAVIAEDSFADTAKARTIDLIDDTGGVLVPAQVNVKVYATDELAISNPAEVGDAGGLGLLDVDLDANGATTDTNVQVGDLRCVGVKVEVTWRPGSWRPGDPDMTVRLCALLY